VNILFKAVKSRYIHKNQPFGKELFHTVRVAVELDSETETTFWIDEIRRYDPHYYKYLLQVHCKAFPNLFVPIILLFIYNRVSVASGF
jgi:hypothetical protein